MPEILSSKKKTWPEKKKFPKPHSNNLTEENATFVTLEILAKLLNIGDFRMISAI